MITSPMLPAYVRGVAELETTDRGIRRHRLPGWVRHQFPDPQLLGSESSPRAHVWSCVRPPPPSSW